LFDLTPAAITQSNTTLMYQLLSGKTNKLRLVCIWVKCGFSSAATSAFYTFKIRRSAGPQIRILPPASATPLEVRVVRLP